MSNAAPVEGGAMPSPERGDPDAAPAPAAARGAPDQTGTERPPSAPTAASAPALRPLDELRALLFIAERQAIQRLRERLDDPDLRADEVSRVVVEALALAGARGPELARALLPALDRALELAVARDPRALGFGLERAIASALDATTARRRAGRLDRLERSISPRALRLRLLAFLARRPFPGVIEAHDLVYRVEHVLLLDARTGAAIEQASSARVSAADRELVARALGPVQSFLRTTKRPEAVNVVRVEDRAVFLEVAEHATLAAIVRGTPPADLPARLARALEAAHATWRAQLARVATGGPVPDGLRGLLEACLEEEYRSSPERRRRFVGQAIAAVLVVALAASGLRLWMGWRWGRAVAAVDAIPGIVVTSHGPPFGRRSIAGLRDPLAKDPTRTLASFGYEGEDVELGLEPFVSLDPLLVLERATRLLDPPRGVTLSARDGLVKATGSAPHAWIAEARQLARALPGLAGLDEEELVDADIERLAVLASRIEERTVSFPAGSAAIPASELPALRETAQAINELRIASTALRQQPRVLVLGTPGPGGAGQALASERAARVVAALVQLGAEPAVLGSRAGRPGTASAADRPIAFDVNLEDLPE